MIGCAETQYIFDSSFEMGYITADVYEWLYNLEFNLDYMIDYSNNDMSLKDLHDKLDKAEVRGILYDDSNCELDMQSLVTKFFNNSYKSMDLINKSYYDLSILFGSYEQPASMKYLMSKRLVECFYQDGYQLPLKIITDIGELSNYDNMEFIMENDGTISSWLSRMKARIQESSANLHQVDKIELRDHLQMMNEIKEARIRKHYESMNREYALINSRSDQSFSLSYGDFTSNEKKKGRKAITRAIDLFGKFFNKSDIEGFIKGYEYIVEGEKFNYRLTKGDRTNILHQTLKPLSIHIPYDLEITTKNNIVLAKACYVFVNTPIIDQIIAFTMMIKSGNEDEFIEEANLFQKTEAFYGSELQTVRQSPPEKQLKVTEQDIWINRISESCDKLFAKHLGISEGEWYNLCNVNNNFGYVLSSPDSVLDLNISLPKLLTNGV